MKKIIITGVGRTGTTALATILSQSKNILVVNELGIFDNDPNNYYSRKDKWINGRCNTRFLKEKGLTEADIDNFFIGNFENKGNLEFFGDKWPTYSTSKEYCKYLAKYHADAYYIFTYRNPCGIINSNIKRTKFEKNEIADWYFRSIEESLNKIIDQTNNWSQDLYPKVEKKIIIDYDYYINNFDLLINDLSIFLDTKIDIPEPEKVLGHTEIFETGFRGLYEHPNPNEYMDNLSQKEIDFILDKTLLIDYRIKSLINKN
jgi:hypothetical protein